MFTVRTSVPGGKLTAEQFLTELSLGERLGNGALRITRATRSRRNARCRSRALFGNKGGGQQRGRSSFRFLF
ncbi:MAG: hypothetical protein HY000_02860 [Planctomycetes bacterium]|nr:hypothetical protein [Planctomycetota bacterium]